MSVRARSGLVLLLVRILPTPAIGTLEVWLVTHEDLRHVPRVRAVMEHLAGEFRKPAR